METTINQRFEIICKNNNLNVSSFSKRINVSQPTIKAIFDGKTKPSYETIVRVLNEFNVTAEWLILEKGNMYYENIVNAITEDNETIKQMLNMISDLSGKNAILQAKLNQYKKYNIAAEPENEYGK